MCGIMVCLSAAVLGVDYGWQPVAGGGIEYIIQIEPELLDSLKEGHDLFSDLPPAMRNIRSYRITVGSGRLPHHGEPPPATNGPTNETGASGSSSAAEAAAAPANVDLSQLPGPILGPAFGLQPPTNGLDEDEPPHLVESEAKPLANRVAGYHGKSDAPAGDEEEEASSGESQPAAKGRSAGKKESPGAPAEKDASTSQEEHDSPSDRAPAVPQTMASPVVQLGLFASLCGNVFLLWVAAGQRSSYRALVRRMFESRAEHTPALPSVVASMPRFEQITASERADAGSILDASSNETGERHA